MATPTATCFVSLRFNVPSPCISCACSLQRQTAPPHRLWTSRPQLCNSVHLPSLSSNAKSSRINLIPFPMLSPEPSLPPAVSSRPLPIPPKSHALSRMTPMGSPPSSFDVSPPLWSRKLDELMEKVSPLSQRLILGVRSCTVVALEIPTSPTASLSKRRYATRTRLSFTRAT